MVRRLARFLPGQMLIETIGRRSGLPRQTPIGGLLQGSTCWLVSEFGRHSQYVRNIAANPQVRVFAHGKWHTGTAVILDEDDPRQRLKQLPRYNSFMVQRIGTNLLTLRVDLDK